LYLRPYSEHMWDLADPIHAAPSCLFPPTSCPSPVGAPFLVLWRVRFSALGPTEMVLLLARCTCDIFFLLQAPQQHAHPACSVSTWKGPFFSFPCHVVSFFPTFCRYPSNSPLQLNPVSRYPFHSHSLGTPATCNTPLLTFPLSRYTYNTPLLYLACTTLPPSFPPCRYPSNEHLFRMFARFLEHVRSDPWSAQKYAL
jgi:hypothetical protein